MCAKLPNQHPEHWLIACFWTLCVIDLIVLPFWIWWRACIWSPICLCGIKVQLYSTIMLLLDPSHRLGRVHESLQRYCALSLSSSLRLEPDFLLCLLSSVRLALNSRESPPSLYNPNSLMRLCQKRGGQLGQSEDGNANFLEFHSRIVIVGVIFLRPICTQMTVCTNSWH